MRRQTSKKKMKISPCGKITRLVKTTSCWYTTHKLVHPSSLECWCQLEVDFHLMWANPWLYLKKMILNLPWQQHLSVQSTLGCYCCCRLKSITSVEDVTARWLCALSTTGNKRKGPERRREGTLSNDHIAFKHQDNDTQVGQLPFLTCPLTFLQLLTFPFSNLSN